ncbi:hypothetical protein RHMOL_Rhmol03G0171700 [Rhododendron molle]|uniref:Uncharacterized protein n=1 Tax=Rhododendron molle TaxID=49168 RepID=A0ACC0PFP7_RHOML|nr:hypothetical protein RHMOL_Rhmol03G0171700 [Rhododendron molle]
MGERSTKREREEEEERSPTTPATHRQGRPPQLPVLAHHHLRRPPAHPFEKIASPSRNHRRQTHLPPSAVFFLAICLKHSPDDSCCIKADAAEVVRQVISTFFCRLNGYMIPNLCLY